MEDGIEGTKLEKVGIGLVSVMAFLSAFAIGKGLYDNYQPQYHQRPCVCEQIKTQQFPSDTEIAR